MEPAVSAKDFSDYYHDSIALSLEKIDNYADALSSRPYLILNMKYELDKVFRRIHNRLNTDNAARQKEYIRKLNKLKPITTARIKDEETGMYKTVIRKTSVYNEYKEIVMDRLLHTWDCLDELGMTSKKKPESVLY
jgi:hypothetical protein